MKVLVPFDGSEYSEKALDYAISIYPGSDICILYVIDPVGRGGGKQTKASWWNMWYEDVQSTAQEILDEARELAGEEADRITFSSRTGKPSKVILDFIEEEGINAVVMGRQSEEGLSHVLLGSVADKVIRHTDIPVTLVG